MTANTCRSRTPTPPSRPTERRTMFKGAAGATTDNVSVCVWVIELESSGFPETPVAVKVTGAAGHGSVGSRGQHKRLRRPDPHRRRARRHAHPRRQAAQHQRDAARRALHRRHLEDDGRRAALRDGDRSPSGRSPATGQSPAARCCRSQPTSTGEHTPSQPPAEIHRLRIRPKPSALLLPTEMPLRLCPS